MIKFLKLFVFIAVIECTNSYGQSFYGDIFVTTHELLLDNPPCSCSLVAICGGGSTAQDAATFSFEGVFYGGGNPSILTKNPLTCDWSWITPSWSALNLAGLVSTSEGIFYAIEHPGNNNSVYQIDVLNSTYSIVGNSPFPISGTSSDLCMFNGGVYYMSSIGLIQLNISNPSASQLIQTINDAEYYDGLTASPWCNTLLASYEEPGWTYGEIRMVNIVDGSTSVLCEVHEHFDAFSSMYEYTIPAPCELMLDLDCNNDNLTSYFTCLTPDGVPVADIDIRLFSDDWIQEMTITIASPVTDAPDEILLMNGSVPNIDVTGLGTEMITLTNLGGATIEDFKIALQLIRYNNLAAMPTEGIRNIEAQFTSASGSTSEITYYFVDVSEIPLTPIDLGNDLEECDGTSVTLDAGNPGAEYEWSTGDNTQIITVSESGQYIVTVNDGVNCPNQDTVVIDILPIIHIMLIGDTDICDNEQATLTIVTDSPFPISVTIDADPGSPFVFTGITDTYTFTDLPFVTTTYTITEVVPDQPGCIEIPDPEQVIEVYPTYVFENEVSLCDGDSIWLGFFWETEAGSYENLLESIYGCDSMVTTYITILPAVHIAQQSTTCDPSAAGVFITHLDNPNGCDTVVTTTVTLLPSDTTHIALSTCVWTQAGITTDTLSNRNGCDSLIITTTSYVPPSDTTFLYQSNCDSSQLGVLLDTLSALDGCDSLVVLTTTFSLTDTTYLYNESCDSLQVGVKYYAATGSDGCDSLVIETITQGLPDTTLIFATSCDSASLGVFEVLLISSQGCDSLIITTVTYSAQDSTFITSSTCDPAASGIFVTSLINQLGCDSIVTETVSLLPSDDSSIQSTTCDQSAAGVFTQMLTNQYGCDSIVTETVTLLPSDQTAIASTTCIASQTGIFITSLTNQYGCDSVITETITLLPGDTTSFTFNTCDPAQVGAIETVYTGHDGCDSLVIETTTLYPLPVLQVQSAIDYNGFDISCAGDADGSAIANVSGVPPYTYLWSTKDTDQLITGLSAGNYAVSVTDGNGCSTDGVITLNEPALFMIGFEVSEPDCFDQQLGSITVKPSGGVAPYTYSIDGTIFQASPDFSGLSEGIYQITSLDANDCSATEIISIDVPLMVQVALGDNQVISIGDSAQLQAIINLPFDSLSSILWTGIDSIDCPNCLTQIVAPIITTAYSVSVTSIDGCADRDSLTVSVTTDQKVYVPNIFSPNGDGINDMLSISMGDGVQEISAFEIFDRWGNMVFQAEHVLPSNHVISWDGKMHGETLNSGVFTYKIIVVFANGEREVRYGDVTLLR